jgi:hypothetical protein
VRLAPAIDGGKAYFGSDDGCVYCVDAATGELAWKFRAAPEEHKIIGNGRLISLWPVRTGVLVDQGVAYFSAGIFASEGVFSYAVDAASGKLIWKNDREGESRLKHVSPTGYQLATDEALVVPMGRMAPAVYDRKSGELLHKLFIYYGGGTFCTMYENLLFSGWGAAYCFPIKRSHPGLGEYGTSKSLGSFPGGRLVYSDGMVYSCAIPKNEGVSTSVTAIPWRPSGRHRRRPDGQRADACGGQRLDGAVLDGRIDHPGRQNALRGRQGPACRVGRRGRQDALVAENAWFGAAPGAQQRAAVCLHGHGRNLLLRPAGAKRSGAAAQAVEDVKVPPTLAEAAAAVLKLVPETRKGFALVYGVETGELALELARRTALNIVAVSPDAAKVEAARTLLDKAGCLRRARGCAAGAAGEAAFTKYFANLVVSETALATGQPCGSAAEMVRVCTPVRGAVVLGGFRRGVQGMGGGNPAGGSRGEGRMGGLPATGAARRRQLDGPVRDGGFGGHQRRRPCARALPRAVVRRSGL